MAGERTQNIVSMVRDFLKDHTAMLIPNDVIIYNYINKYQLYWAVDKETTKHFYEIFLTAGVTKYYLHPRAFSILNYTIPETNTYHYSGRYQESDNSIIIESADMVTGDKIIVEAFIRPVFNASWKQGEEIEAVPVNDKITKSTDPIIEPDYDFELARAVCSNYSTKSNPQPTIEQVEKDVSKLALKLARKNRWSTGVQQATIITQYSRNF